MFAGIDVASEHHTLAHPRRHRYRLRQDFDDRVRKLDRHLLAEYPTARAFTRAYPQRLAKLRQGGRHLVGDELARQLIETSKRLIGRHHGTAYTLQARHICQDLDLQRRHLGEIESDIENLLETRSAKLLTTIEGIGPQSAARVIAAVGDPARFRSAAGKPPKLALVNAMRKLLHDALQRR